MTSETVINSPDNVLPFDDFSSIQTQAREWLIRLDRDTPPSAAEKESLRQWLAQSSAHRRELERISAFWDDANILNELSTPVYDQASNRWRELLTPLTRLPTTVWGRSGAIAASFALAMVMVFALLPAANDSTNGIYVSALGEVQEQKLVDGSIIKLNTDSQIQVEYSDGQRKIRLLRGEVHFDVASNQDWPFQVYAGSGMVKAVGTAFSVRLHPDAVQVIVNEGQVDLSSAVQVEQAAPITKMHKLASLDSGQSLTLKRVQGSDPQQPQLQQLQPITQIPAPELERKLAWRSGYLVFVGDPLIEVIAEMSRYTTININIPDPALQQLRVGGRFKVGELDAMFDVLQTSFGIHVSHLDSQHIQLQSAP